MIDLIKEVEKQNVGFFHDIGNDNLFILGDSDAGKTVVMQDMLLQQKDTERKLLIISPFDEFHEVVEVSGGQHHRMEKQNNIETITLADRTSFSFMGTDLQQHIHAIIDMFAKVFAGSEMTIYIDGLSYLFVTEEQQMEILAKVAHYENIQFIISSQVLHTEATRAISFIFPNQFVMRTSLDGMFVLGEVGVEVDPKKFAFAEGLIVSRDSSYLFRYTFCNAYRNLFFNER